jgi:predicted lipoprotein with Yx(FWY)xxD motif
MSAEGWLRHARRGLLALGLIVATGLVVACGGDDDDNDDGGAVTTSTRPAGGATAAPTATSVGGPSTREPAESGLDVNVGQAGEIGTVLTGANGLTLYTFANDTAGSGASACVDGCANAWPPLTIDSAEPAGPPQISAELGTITRPDGTTQVTYKGLPLYFFANDSAPGDANGHELNNIWFAAIP